MAQSWTAAAVAATPIDVVAAGACRRSAEDAPFVVPAVVVAAKQTAPHIAVEPIVVVAAVVARVSVTGTGVECY